MGMSLIIIGILNKKSRIKKYTIYKFLLTHYLIDITLIISQSLARLVELQKLFKTHEITTYEPEKHDYTNKVFLNFLHFFR